MSTLATSVNSPELSKAKIKAAHKRLVVTPFHMPPWNTTSVYFPGYQMYLGFRQRMARTTVPWLDRTNTEKIMEK